MLLHRLAPLLAAGAIPLSAYATNGMNLEGYGPIASGMGGASVAYDNGNADMINNPATLGFLPEGRQRFSLFLGGLGPTVSSNGQRSAADSFVMPAVGYVRKDGQFSWGVGMMAQGGMGTEYQNGAFWGALAQSNPGAVDMLSGAALGNLSEVGVGRILFPLVYQVDERLNVGGSLDFVWAGMDVQWLIDGAHFADMMPGRPQRFGSVSGTMVNGFQGMMVPGGIQAIGWGYFDFNKSGKFFQQATATGWAGNLGLTYRLTPRLTLGAIYHAKTRLKDLATSGNGATASFNVDFGGVATTIPVAGKVVVHDFEWPETWVVGLAWRASDDWLFAADYKRINWADVMRNFKMSFIASGTQSGMATAFAGSELNMIYRQEWRNQNVLMLGASYRYNDRTTLRFGVNLANNPVPDAYLSPLFPAIIKRHFNAGISYRCDNGSNWIASLSIVPRVTATNRWGMVGGENQTISHRQFNWQVAYGMPF